MSWLYFKKSSYPKILVQKNSSARPLRSAAHTLVAKSASKESNLSNKEAKAVLRSAFLQNLDNSNNNSDDSDDNAVEVLAVPQRARVSSKDSSKDKGNEIKNVRSRTREELRRQSRAKLAASPLLQ